uniref:Methyltransferase domain-containing protein n=1 Tax=Phaeomonas parva TaxID=124430 RepID=A0A6U4EQ90_9STRA|mmetsp:Transcript_21927/g.67340  ORF Transcript_21927/g.67340 Transcript_21927/m.67340 type:complete len:245 (+) Transcript_21927:308-1042(+)
MGLVRVAVAALAGAALVRDTEGFAGFGSRPKPAKGKPKKGKGGLAPDAAKILDKANGNLDAAQGMLFQQQAMKLKDKDPALFRAMETHAAGTPMPDAMHEKLVELTWDTVAAYLPVTASRAPADDVKEKLRAIAVACGEGAVLDVGCGDGAIIPFLKERGLEADDYVGVDVSGRMIDVARATHKKFKFVQGNFMTDDSSGDEPKYDCVLFNGSLQFATDVAAMLRRAKGCLREVHPILINPTPP